MCGYYKIYKCYKTRIKKEKSMKYKIVGYGSLLSHKSLEETVPNKHFEQVIIKGYKRIFDLVEGAKKHKDVLNLVKSPDSFFNGVMFSLSLAELKKIKKREDIYNLEETWAYDFQSRKKLCKCLICIDPFIDIDKRGILPDKHYFILCREAAYHISKKFGELWDKTTFTAGDQKIRDWLTKNPGYDTITIKN